MKKLLAILLSVIAVCMAGSSASATESSVEKLEMDSAVAAIIAQQISEEEISMLQNNAYYDETMQDKTISTQPILQQYYCIPWDLADRPVEEIVSMTQAYISRLWNDAQYLVLGNSPFDVNVKNSTTEPKAIWMIDDYQFEMRPYIRDLYMLTEKFRVDGEEYTLEGVYFFEEHTMYEHITLIYLCTDKKDFALYYATESSEALLMEKDEFAKYAIAYYDYLVEYAGDDDELLDIGYNPIASFMGFNSFMGDCSANHSFEPIQSERTMQPTENSEQPASGVNPLVYAGIAGGVLVLAGGATGFAVVYRRKKANI